MKGPKKQQVVTVFKHGPKPRRMCRVLVAKSSSIGQVKMEISEGLGISAQEPVILNSMAGHEVNTVYDILTERNNIIIASFPGEFDVGVYRRNFRQPGIRHSQHHNPTLHNIPPLYLPYSGCVKSALKTKPRSSPRHVKFSSPIESIASCQAKGAYNRIPPPSQRVPAMSATRLPPISTGTWDSSDGRSSGSDILQRRVGYERQMKREYNARHSTRMNKLKDEAAMEVSDILMTRERQMRAEHQIRLERRQKLALKHLQDDHRMHQNNRKPEKIRTEKSYPKKLNDKVMVGRRMGGGEYQNVVNIFTNSNQKLPANLNKHSVLPSLRQQKPEPHIPTAIPKRTLLDPQPKRRRDKLELKKLSTAHAPDKTPIPSIKQKPKPEIVQQTRETAAHTPKSHISVASSSHYPPSTTYSETPDLIEAGNKAALPNIKIFDSVTPTSNKTRQSTPAKPRPSAVRPSTPTIKPSTTSSRKLSSTSIAEKLSVAEEPEYAGSDQDIIHRVHTPKDDLGYDSPKQTPKHPKLSLVETEEEMKLPAKLTQRDSGLADSIEPDSTESRRQSVTPSVDNSPEIIEEQSETEESFTKKLDPVTEETETESPPLDLLKFKPMLEVLSPKSETALNNAYIMGQTLGDGNFAIVKNALNKVNKEAVAIKIIDKDKLKGKESMMLNEIKIMRKLDHKNCVKLFDIYESEPYIYLVTELVKDGDLFDCIVKNRCFAEPTVRCMIYDMVSALDYMHSRKIVHRDIKPENILVNRRGGKYELKLGDFGLSMVVTEHIYTICGTPTYIAPEILVECGYGLEIDMWAIGVINYILLCGFPPFRSKNKDQEELFSLIMAGEFRFISPYWDKVSHGAKDLISRLLQVVPDERFTARQVLNHPWLRGTEE